MRNIALAPVAAVALLSLAACGDAATTSAFPSQTTPLPPMAGTIRVVAREIPVGVSMMLQGPLLTSPYEDQIDGPYRWSTRDPSVATTNTGTSHFTWVRGLSKGVTELYVEASRVRATVPITVLDTLRSAPSPVVVDDFYVTEFDADGAWGYAPQLVLSDTVGRLDAAVIGISIELPGAGGSPRCAMLRTVRGTRDSVFRASYGEFELWINGPAGYRVPSGQLVIAHVTLRVPGPYAKELTLQGRVVPGTWPDRFTGVATSDALSCG